MSQTSIDSRNLSIAQTNNMLVPPEGPKAMPVLLDFSVLNPGDVISLDLAMREWQSVFSMLQTIYIDAADSTVPVTLIIAGTGQRIVAKAHTQGYYNLLAPNPTQLTFSCDGGPVVTVQLCNSYIPGMVWPTQ